MLKVRKLKYISVAVFTPIQKEPFTLMLSMYVLFSTLDEISNSSIKRAIYNVETIRCERGRSFTTLSWYVLACLIREI